MLHQIGTDVPTNLGDTTDFLWVVHSYDAATGKGTAIGFNPKNNWVYVLKLRNGVVTDRQPWTVWAFFRGNVTTLPFDIKRKVADLLPRHLPRPSVWR